MELWIIRHGKAEDPAASAGADRALVARGRDQSRRLGRLVRQAGALPSIVLCSPMLRARQTAELFCEEAGLPGPVVQGWLSCGMCPEAAWAQLASFREFRRVAVVGHEPDLSGFIAYLMGCPHGAVRMKKGSAALLSLWPPAVTARLEALLPPKLVEDAD